MWVRALSPMAGPTSAGSTVGSARTAGGHSGRLLWRVGRLNREHCSFDLNIVQRKSRSSLRTGVEEGKGVDIKFRDAPLSRYGRESLLLGSTEANCENGCRVGYCQV
jgi:hypothetical protein